ncbi:hypothetical protein F4802DRAFT_550544 [Xylaria palmicola]|nr:hypothetical protein F4802DRAFT_550544 [Xylaria palmicola]
MSSRGSYTISMPSNMSPPHDLASYSRSMHSHTKRQMEAANMSSTRRGSGGSGGNHSQTSPVSSMPNGTTANPQSSTRMNGSHEYHS